MATLPEQILRLIAKNSGLTDREITNVLRGSGALQQPINQAAHNLEKKGLLVRRKRSDGLIGNYPTGVKVAQPRPLPKPQNPESSQGLSEDELKAFLKNWLHEDGWKTDIAWGKTPGIDLVATRGSERWVIEVKGIGSRPQMRVNYFLAILGETLQRMDDPRAKYSIALPDVQQFRRLWQRLPQLAKERTGITALFVSDDGLVIDELD